MLSMLMCYLTQLSLIMDMIIIEMQNDFNTISDLENLEKRETRLGVCFLPWRRTRGV